MVPRRCTSLIFCCWCAVGQAGTGRRRRSSATACIHRQHTRALWLSPLGPTSPPFPSLSHASTRRRRALLHPHNAGRSLPQPRQAHHTPQPHLLSEPRRDPATNTTPSLRKEPRFASSSVQGKDGKRDVKKVSKTPVHPPNCEPHVAECCLNLSICLC